MFQNYPKIAAIIPAFNEEKTINQVVKAVKQVELINQIIVVDDGSIDRTAKIARQAGAEVISLPQNQGKGQAMQKGVNYSQAEIIVFIDADLINLSSEHIHLVLRPILNRHCQMTTGTLERGQFLNKINRWLEAPFSGLRVVERSLWDLVPLRFKKNYLAESAIHWTAKWARLKNKNFILYGLEHIRKTQKKGFWEGSWAFLKMWSSIIIQFPVLFCFQLRRNFNWRGTKAA